jgi:MoxR-like ATPase
VVADEIDRASGDVFAILLNMFDNPESATWQHPETGVVLRPRPGFSVVMTSNIRHADDLPVALRDRFPVAIRIDQPHPAAVSRLSSDLQQAAFALAAADDDRRLSLRAFMAFEKLRNSLGAERAAAIVFGDRSTDVLDAMRVDAVA